VRGRDRERITRFNNQKEEESETNSIDEEEDKRNNDDWGSTWDGDEPFS